MIKKTVTVVAKILNIAVITSMVGIGAYSIQEAQAKTALAYISQQDRYCMQQNVYFEARNQSTLGQVAVAWVTLNRMESSTYPDTVCEVVWQRKQFSWTHDNKSDQPGSNAIEQRAWEDAGVVAEVVLLDWARARQSPIDQAVMYHADYVDPYWASSYDRVAKIDAHIFYK